MHDRWQRLVVDLDQFGRILGRGDGLGDHHCDRFADIADRVDRQRKMRGRDRRDSADPRPHIGRVGQAGIVRDRPEPIGAGVGPGQDRQYPGGSPRRGAVDGAQPGMGMRRTHKHGMRHPRQDDIIAKPPAPGQQPKILLAPHRLPDAGRIRACPHRSSVLVRGAAPD